MSAGASQQQQHASQVGILPSAHHRHHTSLICAGHKKCIYLVTELDMYKYSHLAPNYIRLHTSLCTVNMHNPIFVYATTKSLDEREA